MSAAIADTLRRRGVTDPAASLTAKARTAVFKIAFERWINETNEQDFGQLIRDPLDELKALTAGNDHRAKFEREVMPATGSASPAQLAARGRHAIVTGATRMRVSPADGLPVPGHPSVADAFVGISFDRCSTGTGQQQAIAPLALAITGRRCSTRACGKILHVDVLASRIILHPTDPTVSQRFYRDTLGLAVYREFGPPESPGMVFYAGQGLIEISGHSDQPGSSSTAIWLQVRDVTREHARLAEQARRSSAVRSGSSGG